MICVYDDCYNKVVTSKSGCDNGNMVTLPWLPFYNRLMELSYFWRSTTKMIDINVYNTCAFVLCKRKKVWAQSHYILNSPRMPYSDSHNFCFFWSLCWCCFYHMYRKGQRVKIYMFNMFIIYSFYYNQSPRIYHTTLVCYQCLIFTSIAFNNYKSINKLYKLIWYPTKEAELWVPPPAANIVLNDLY